jgi:hypothetical protein
MFNDNIYTADEKKKALKEARSDALNKDLMLTGGGAGAYFGAKALDNYIKNSLQEDTKEGLKIKAREFTRDLNPEEIAKLEGMQKRLMAFNALRYPSLIGKSVGLVAGLTGAAKLGIGQGTRLIDPERQGVLDDDYIKGKRDNYLIGAGATALGAGTLASYLISRKLGKSLFNKIDIRDLNNPVLEINPKIKKTMDAVENTQDFNSAEGYAKFRQSLLDMKNTAEGEFKKNNVNGNDLRNLGISQGVAGIGGMALSGGIASKLLGNEYKEKLEKNRELAKTSSLNKTAFGLIEGAVAAHGAQNLIGMGLLKTERGRKMLGDFLARSLQEGYHGKAYGGKIRGGVEGVLSNIMPELNGMRKHVRRLGAKLKEDGVDLNKLNDADKKVLEGLAVGDLHSVFNHLPDSPAGRRLVKTFLPEHIKDEAVIAGAVEGKNAIPKETIDKIQDLYRQTTTQKLLSGVNDSIKSGKITEPKGAPLSEIVKHEQAGDAVGHMGLVPMEPGAALFNGIKKSVMADDIALKPTDSQLVGGLKNVFNKTKKGIQVIFDEAPNQLAKAKGALGMNDESALYRLAVKDLAFNPVAEAARRDNYLAGKIGRVLAEKLNVGEEGAKHLADMENGAKKVVNSLDGNMLAAPFKMGAAAYREARKYNVTPGEAKNMFGILSHDPKKVAEAENAMIDVGQRVYNKNLDKIEGFIDRRTADALEAQKKAEDKLSEVDMRIQKWKLPGLALGGTAIASPMLYGIAQRNFGQQKKQPV